MNVYGIDDGEGKIAIIAGTKCSEVECREHGCAFPDCAKLGDRFKTVEDAKREHPDIVML